MPVHGNMRERIKNYHSNVAVEGVSKLINEATLLTNYKLQKLSLTFYVAAKGSQVCSESFCVPQGQPRRGCTLQT